MAQSESSAPAPSDSPCFHFASCGHYAALEKSGKSLCSECARRYPGIEYPLREPSREPLYATIREARAALGFEDPRDAEETRAAPWRPRARQLHLGRELPRLESRFIAR